MSSSNLKRFASLVAVIVAAFGAASSFGQSFTPTALTGFFAGGIDNSGTIYGTYSNQAAYWSGGTVTVPTGAAAYGHLTGGNGSIYVGTTGQPPVQAAVYSGGSVTSLATALGTPYASEALGLTSSGYAYGWTQSAASTYSGGFIYNTSNSTATLLSGFTRLYSMNATTAVGYLTVSTKNVAYSYNVGTSTYTNIQSSLGSGIISSSAQGINTSGTIVGFADKSGLDEGFVDSGGSVTWLTGVGGSTSAAFADNINDNGWVIGDSAITAGGSTDHATLWANGETIDLNSFVTLSGGDYLQYADYINNSGTIIAESHAGNYYELSVSAVPEPRTWGLILGSVALAGVWVARRRARSQAAA